MTTKDRVDLLTEEERKRPAEILEYAASSLEDAASRLRRFAEEFRRTGDTDYLSFAMNTVTNIFQNIRLDLFVKYAGEAFKMRLITITSTLERLENNGL